MRWVFKWCQLVDKNMYKYTELILFLEFGHSLIGLAIPGPVN